MIEIEVNSIEVYYRILLQKTIYPLFSCLHKGSIRLINISMNESSPFILTKVTEIEMYQTKYHSFLHLSLIDKLKYVKYVQAKVLEQIM